MAKILVTGADGQVGSALQALGRRQTEHKFIFADREEMDLEDYSSMDAMFRRDFQYVFNCAAYTAVDKAETDQTLANAINHLAVAELAQRCAVKGTPLIHLSTDYVYDQSHCVPIKEDGGTHPLGVYAQTKLDGDLAALAHYDKSTVIRTSWVYYQQGNNFVKTMLKLGKERSQLNVIYDQIGTPTYARDLAAAMISMVSKVESWEVEESHLSGIYHYSNEGVCSWYDFAMAIFEMKGISCNVLPIETKDYPTPAHRPNYSLLNKSKIKDNFGLTIPHWRESLRICLGKLL